MFVCGYSICRPPRIIEKGGQVRLLKQEERKNPCGVCQVLYGEEDEVKLWVAYDGCNTWFHGDCVNISKDNEPDEFICESCA